MAWQASKFHVTVRSGNGPAPLLVDGWTNGLFALEPRENRTWLGKARRGKVWCLSHLPTGFVVRCLIGRRKEVMQVADEIAGAADWDFTNADEAMTRGPAVFAIMQRNPDAFVPSDEVGPPIAAPHVSTIFDRVIPTGSAPA